MAYRNQITSIVFGTLLLAAPAGAQDAEPAATGLTSTPETGDQTPDANTAGGVGVDAESTAEAEKEPPQDAQDTQESESRGSGRGLRSVLDLFAGKSVTNEPTVEAVKSQDNAELLRRVNELARLATTSIEKGRVSEAMRNINDLISLKPYDANYHFALGLCYRKERRFSEALKKYQDVLDLGGPKALVAVLKAEAFGALRQPDKVYEFLKEAAIGGRNVIMDVKTLPLLSGYQQDTEFIKLALQLEKFSVRKGQNHDPFTNPFPKPDASGTAGGASRNEVVTLTPEEQQKLLMDARKTYERVKFYIKLEDESKAMTAYTSLREMVEKKDLITIPKISNDFRVLIAQLEGLEIEIEGIRLKYYYNQGQEKLKQMQVLFADGEYNNVEKLHNELAKLVEEMKAANENYIPVADQILAASGKWLKRAQVRREFQERKPIVQGIVIADGGKMALLNQKLVKQGDSFEDFRVVGVESNKVTFRYKGEEIPVIFRRY